MQKSLRGRAFALIALWQCLGVFGFINPLWLVLYSVGMLAIIVAVIADYLSLAPTPPFGCQFSGPNQLNLDSAATWHWQLTPSTAGAAFGPSWLFFPDSPLWDNDHPGALVTPGKALVYEQHLRARKLGQETITNTYLRTPSKAGLWMALYQLPQTLPIAVGPSVANLPPKERPHYLRHVRNLILGSRRVVKQRQRDQVHSIRPYQSGDNIRDIDARKSARFHRLMTREYDSLINQHLIIGLDLGRSLSGWMRYSAKLDFYLEACANLYKTASAANDRVSFFAFHQDIVLLEQSRHSHDGLRGFQNARGQLCTQDVESNYELIPSLVNRLGPQRSIVVIMSDLTRPSVQESLKEAFAYIGQKHQSLAVGILDARYNLKNLAGHSDPWHQWSLDVYRAWTAEHFETFSSDISKLGGGALLCPERYWLAMVASVYAMMRNSSAA